MSTTIISFSHKVDGALTDCTSVYLSDPTGTYGVKRTDNDATVVADQTAMTKSATGQYTYEITDPASDLTYNYYVEWTYGGLTHYAEFTKAGTVGTGTYQEFSLKTMAVAVLDYLDASSTDTDIAAGGVSYDLYTRAKAWVNMAMQEFADYGPWYFLKKSFQEVTLSEDAYTADLPVDVHRLLTDAAYEDYSVLFQPTSLQSIQQLRAVDGTTSGTPRVVGLSWNSSTSRHQLVVWPPADEEKTLIVAYTRKLPQLVEATDEPAIPSEYHRIIRLGALAIAEEEGERNWNGGARERYSREVEQAWRRAAQSHMTKRHMRGHRTFHKEYRAMSDRHDVTPVYPT